MLIGRGATSRVAWLGYKPLLLPLALALRLSTAQVEPTTSWAIRAGGVGTDYVERLAMDPLRALFAMGRFGLFEADFGRAALAGTFGSTTLTSEGGQDLFEMKVQADTGTVDWAMKSRGPVKKDPFIGKAVHTSGIIYETGRFHGTRRFGAVSLVSEGKSADIYVSKSVNGTLDWARSWGGAGNDAGRAVAALASDGGVVVAGYFSGLVVFNDTELASQGAQDAFVMLLDPDGHPSWVKQFGSANGRLVCNDVVTTSEAVYLTGYLEGTVTVEGSVLTGRGAGDVFALKLSLLDGVVIWALAAGGDGDDAGTAVVAEPTGEVFIAGHFSGVANFSTASSLESAGGSDVFVWKVVA